MSDRKEWNAWGDSDAPKTRPHDQGTLSLLWLKLRRLGSTRTATPTDDQEGMLRYDRDGNVDGVLSLARSLVGGTREWEQLNAKLPLTGGTVTGNLQIGDAQSDVLTVVSHIGVSGPDPVIVNTPVGTYPGAGTTPTSASVLGNDTAFRVSFTTGTLPAVGLIFNVAFATARASANYDVWFTPNTVAAEPVLLHTTNRATTGFDVVCSTTAPAASSAVGWGLFVIGY